MTTEAPEQAQTIDLDAFTTRRPLETPLETEQPRRRRRRQAEPLAGEGEQSSADKPRRAYTRRTSDPCKLVAAQEAELRTQLAGMFIMTGGGLAMAMAVTGTTLAMRAEQEAQALIDIAKVNSKFAAALLKIAESTAYSGLVMCVMALGTAVMVDVRAMPPTAPPVQFLIPDVISRFVVEDNTQQSPNGTASSTEYASAASV